MSTAEDVRALDVERERRIERFLVDESAHLDAGRYDEWLALLREDFVYRVPVPLSREDTALDRYDEVLEYADESKSFLAMRFGRVSSDYAWAERPAAFTRHFVTNFRIGPAVADARSGAARWTCRTNVLVVRARLPEPPVLVSAERCDVIEETGEGFLLCRRDVYLDAEVPSESQLGVIF